LGRTPLEMFEDGIYQKTGLPPRLQDEMRVKLDFLPYFERTIQEYGVLLDYIHYYSDVLRPWVHAREEDSPKNKRKRKFVFKRDPRDISVLFFYDPEAKTYFEIPYRDLLRPPMTLWEHKQALRQLESEGVKEINEAVLFEAYQKLRDIEEKAISQTRIVRRQRQQARTQSNRAKSVLQERTMSTPTLDAPATSSKTLGAHPSAQSKISTVSIQAFDELEYEAFD